MSLKIIRCSKQRFDEMLAFVGAHNPAGEHHIGYFGVTPEDIRQSVLMLNLAYTRGFRLALLGNRLVGVCGVDIDPAIGRAWLYGPLVVAEAWADVADALYGAVQTAIPAGIGEHEMFIDSCNANGRAFAQRHAFIGHGEWAIYFITPDRLAALPTPGGSMPVEPWNERWAEPLVALHDSLFPRSNYTLAYMLAEREQGATLLTLADGDRLAGYFFGRAEAESGEAYVDLVGVAPDYQGRGLGRRLMLAGLAELRRLPGLRQVNLTVAANNTTAMRLYDSLGFVKEREMSAFRRQLNAV